jgi:hypothetical protein
MAKTGSPTKGAEPKRFEVLRAGSKVFNQIHAGVQRSHLSFIAIEHQGLALFVEQATLTNAAL